jgi:hypothetical protein|tara:strand:+ start:189 stop:419 length:231 start_codon:yes stop_codon:yes gene_type:complete
MAYGFHFELSNGIHYYEPCKTEEEARSKLENLAKDYCGNGDIGFGKILLMKNDERNILSRYKISFKNEKLIMKELD